MTVVHTYFYIVIKWSLGRLSYIRDRITYEQMYYSYYNYSWNLRRRSVTTVSLQILIKLEM